MATENKVDEIKLETETETETKVKISEVHVTEKKYTDEEVNNIVRKRVEKEKLKTEEANKKVLTLEERVLAIETDKETEKAKKEINEKILLEEQDAFREITINTLISDKVNSNYIDNVKILLKSSIKNEKDSTPEEIEVVIDAIISSLPDGVSKGSSNGSTQLRKIETAFPIKPKTEETKAGEVISNNGKVYKEEELNGAQLGLIKTLR